MIGQDAEVVAKLTLDEAGAVAGATNAQRAVRGVGTAATAANAKVGLVARSLNALKANAVIAGLAAIYGAFRLIGQSVRDAGVQQIAERKLDQALRNTGEAGGKAAAQLRQLAAETQAVSNYGDESIITAQAMLLSFQEVGGAKGAGILTRSLVDMAAGLEKANGEGQDLNQLAATLGKSLVQGAGALKRYGISLTEAQEAAFKAAEGLDRVNLLAEVIQSNFGGMAKATVDPMKQMQNAMGDLSEEAGGPLRDALAQASVRLTVLAQDPGVIAMVRGIGAAFGWLVNATIISFDAVSDAVRSAVIFMRGHVNNLVRVVEGGVRAVGNLMSGLANLASALGPIGRGISGLARDAARSVTEAADAVGAYADAHAEATARQAEGLRAARASRAALDAMIPSVTAATAAAGDLGDASGAAAGSAGDLSDALEKVEAGAQKAKTAVDQIRESIQALKTKAEELRAAGLDELVDLRVQEEDLQRGLDRLEALVERGASRLRDAAAAATLSGAGLNPAGGVAGVGAPTGLDLVGPLMGGMPDRLSADLDAMNERVREGLAKVRESIEAERELTAAEAERFGNAIEAGLARGIADLSEAIGEFAVGAASFGDIGRTLVTSLASLAQQVGGMMVAFGTAALGLQTLLSNPFTAIAAGAALIALGAAAKAAVGGAVGRATAGRSTAPSGNGGTGAGPVPVRPSGPVTSGLHLGGRQRQPPPPVNVTAQAGETVVRISLDGRDITRSAKVTTEKRNRLGGPASDGVGRYQ